MLLFDEKMTILSQSCKRAEDELQKSKKWK